MGPFKRNRHQWQRQSVTERVSAVAEAWVSACSKPASRQRRPLVYFTYRGNKERGPGSRSSRIKVWMNLEPVIGEGDGTPLQCSCLENPRDWGAWWAAIYGVTHPILLLPPIPPSIRVFSSESTLCDPWIATHQASLSITNSWSLLKLMSIKSVMPPSHLILCRALLLSSFGVQVQLP